MHSGTSFSSAQEEETSPDATNNSPAVSYSADDGSSSSDLAHLLVREAHKANHEKMKKEEVPEYATHLGLTRAKTK